MGKITIMSMYLLFSFKQKSKKLIGSKKIIIFTLEQDLLYRDDDGMGRYAYLTLNAFSEAGYNVYLHKNVDTFQKFVQLGKYGRYIYSIKNLKFVSQIPEHIRPEETVYAFDTINKLLLDQTWGKFIYVNICRPTLCQVEKVVWIPYSCHPTAYKSKIDGTIEELRNNNRKLRIIFVGNTVAKGYGLKKLKNWYNKLTRYEGIQAALEIKDKVKNVGDSGKFCKTINEGSYINECRLVRTDCSTKLSVKDYWDIISRSDFFLALSGTDYPMCHNTIESMAVGTIPIMGYSEWFFPPLEHGKNALVYSNAEDLKAKVHDALSMDDQTIKTMRSNVIEYYKKYLTSASFVSEVEADHNKVITIMLHPRLVCTPQENEIGKQFMQELSRQVDGVTTRSKNFEKTESHV